MQQLTKHIIHLAGGLSLKDGNLVGELPTQLSHAWGLNYTKPHKRTLFSANYPFFVHILVTLGTCVCVCGATQPVSLH